MAQVGRRLAESLKKKQPLACKFHGMDAEVVEAACLAHDLGHPPFGHAGESTLDDLIISNGDKEGFEGNAQTFRILTKLSKRYAKHGGLDLTRATLSACLKYPWMRNRAKPSKAKKWSAYRSEKKDFDFARVGCVVDQKTAEAELMDWADDIAYSVHDLEDFHRCGALNWQHILSDKNAEQLVQSATDAWFGAPSDGQKRLAIAFITLRDVLFGEIFSELISNPFEGLLSQRQQLRNLTSMLTGRYFNAIRLVEPPQMSAGNRTVIIDPELHDEMLVLKHITKFHIISNPSLLAQQKGQSRIISELFEDMFADSKKGSPPSYIPPRLRYFWSTDASSKARMVADCISSLTEAEATRLHARIRGLDAGSVLDPIVR